MLWEPNNVSTVQHELMVYENNGLLEKAKHLMDTAPVSLHLQQQGNSRSKSDQARRQAHATSGQIVFGSDAPEESEGDPVHDYG